MTSEQEITALRTKIIELEDKLYVTQKRLLEFERLHGGTSAAWFVDEDELTNNDALQNARRLSTHSWERSERLQRRNSTLEAQSAMAWQLERKIEELKKMLGQKEVALDVKDMKLAGKEKEIEELESILDDMNEQFANREKERDGRIEELEEMVKTKCEPCVKRKDQTLYEW